MTEPAEPREFDAAYWEDRYRRGEGAGKRDPSPSLVTQTEGLPPGRALDAGCGVGGDALWLAARGWHVTAVDVSRTALDSGRGAAEAAGAAFAERIAWVHGDLTAWEPGQQAFDLVTSHYVHVPSPPEVLFRRLASWVAPGGTLLVVGHDGGHGGAGHGSHDGGHGHGSAHSGDHGDAPAHAHPPGARVHAGQVVSGLPEDEWEIVVAEPRTHTMRRPDGGAPVTLHDVVVHARRRPAAHA